MKAIIHVYIIYTCTVHVHVHGYSCGVNDMGLCFMSVHKIIRVYMVSYYNTKPYRCIDYMYILPSVVPYIL